MRKFFYTKLDALVVLTDRDSEKYTFIDRKKLFVIPNSMSFITNDICDINSKKILSVGRLSKQKGFDLLIDALAKIDIKDDWEVNIVGEGEDKNKLINQIREKKLQKQVNILDTTDDIKSLFAASSFYVMSSRWEGLPMVLIEAKTYGLPIVSFDCPEGPSFVVRNGIDGYLVQPENTDELAKKIEMLMKDESLRERMCFESKKDSSRFHPEQIYLLWKDLLNKIDF